MNALVGHHNFQSPLDFHEVCEALSAACFGSVRFIPRQRRPEETRDTLFLEYPILGSEVSISHWMERQAYSIEIQPDRSVMWLVPSEERGRLTYSFVDAFVCSLLSQVREITPLPPNIHQYQPADYQRLLESESLATSDCSLRSRFVFQCQATLEEVAAVFSQRLLGNIRLSPFRGEGSKNKTLVSDRTLMGHSVALSHHVVDDILYYEMQLFPEKDAVKKSDNRVTEEIDLGSWLKTAISDIEPRIYIFDDL